MREADRVGRSALLFEDDSGSIVGDPVTLAIDGGTFANGDKVLEIYGTEGFTDEGDHAAYLTEQIGTWFLVIKEGPERNAPGSDFKDLCRIPISKHRH